MNKLRVAVVDDHVLWRKGLIEGLKNHRNLDFVFEASTGLDLLNWLQTDKANIILLDNRMPKLNGLDTLKEIRKTDDQTVIIMMSAFDDEEYITKAYDENANCFLLKDADGDEFYHAIEICLSAGQYLPIYVKDIIFHKTRPGGEDDFVKIILDLPKKEKQVLLYTLQGKTPKETAAILNIHAKTVDNYKAAIRDKTDIRTNQYLIIRCLDHNLKKLLNDELHFES